jgi:hypothetical protein
MKKIISIVAILFCTLTLTNCDGPTHEDPIVKGILTEWHLIESPLLSKDTDDVIDVYLEFKSDNAFVLYQRDFSTPIYYNTYTGTYLLTDHLITGKYSDGKKWGAVNGYNAEYTVIEEKAMLKLTNVDSPDDVSLFEATVVPAEIKGSAVTMTTRGEEIFDVVRYL